MKAYSTCAHIFIFPGYLFFTDWGVNAIFRVGMNGANFTKLITEKIFWPNGITVDYITKELFWVDARLDVIEYADLNGENRRIVPEVKISHPFAITVFENQMYWTDWMTKAIHKADKWTGKHHTIIKNTTNKPMDIQVCLFVFAVVPHSRQLLIYIYLHLTRFKLSSTSANIFQHSVQRRSTMLDDVTLSERSPFTSEVAGSILSENVLNVTRTQCSTHVKRVSQRSAESRGFSPGTPVSSHREC